MIVDLSQNERYFIGELIQEMYKKLSSEEFSDILSDCEKLYDKLKLSTFLSREK